MKHEDDMKPVLLVLHHECLTLGGGNRKKTADVIYQQVPIKNILQTQQ